MENTYADLKKELLCNIDNVSQLFANPFSKLIGDKILLKKFKHYIATAVDMQAGNLRYDFA